MKSKKLLIDIGHPAQVHQFKNIYSELKKLNYEVLITTKDKDIALYLLNKYEIPYENLGKPKKGLIRKVLYIPISCYAFYKICKKFKPDFILSRFSFHAAWISFILSIKHIGFTDTEHVGLADTLTVPFVNTKLTAYSYNKDLGKNHIRYSGNIELFYLHPKRFKPDSTILKLLNVKMGEKYVIIRFVSWEAHHDHGESGLSLSMKTKFVEELSKYAKIYISSEAELPANLFVYQIKMPPEKMHDALYYAYMYIGEGASMASEAASLGIPSIYINTLTVGYIEEEERQGLLFSFKDGKAAFEKAEELLKRSNFNDFKKLKENFLHQKIDVSAFSVWFIESYPESLEIMKKNPDHQYRFK